jgi:hypothetical protein
MLVTRQRDLAAGSFDEFEPVTPWIAHEEALLARESIARDYLDPCPLEAAAERFEVGDAERGWRRDFLLTDDASFSVVRCSCSMRIGTMRRGCRCRCWRDVRAVQARAAPGRMPRPCERVVTGIDEKVYVIESDNQAHRQSPWRSWSIRFFSCDRSESIALSARDAHGISIRHS